MRVAVLDDYQDAALRTADWGPVAGRAEIVAFTDHVAGTDALVERLAGFDAVVLIRERTALTAELVARLPRLRLVLTIGMRNAAIDLTATAAHGVTVCGTAPPGHSAEHMAEMTWTLILAAARGLALEVPAVRSGGWQQTVGTTLHGKTLGLLGLGTIGSAVARIAPAFGMPVIAWSQNLTAERAEAVGARAVGKAELLETSDVLSVHVQLSDRTRGLVGAADLARMKPSALLVNTSRGPIVDEAALAEALRTGVIAGAGLDAFGTEPLPADDPFRTLPTVVATPHIGYVTDVTYAHAFAGIVEDLAAYLDGAPIRVMTG